MEAGTIIASEGSLGVVLSGDGTKSAGQLSPAAADLPAVDTDDTKAGAVRPERGKRTMSLEEILQAGKA